MEVDVAPFFTHGVSLPNPRLLASANLIALLDDPDIYDESVVWPEHSHVRRAHGIELRRGCDGLVRPCQIEEVFVEGQTHDDVAVRLGLDARQRWIDHLRVRSIVARGDRTKEASSRRDDLVFWRRHGKRRKGPRFHTPDTSHRAMESDKESARINAVTLVSNSDSQQKLRKSSAATETNAQLPAVYLRPGHAH